MKLFLRDKNNKQQVKVLVQNFKDDFVQGVILSHSFDAVLTQKLTELENLVNTQQFGVLGDVTTQIDAYNWQVEGKDWIIFDFQIFNKKDISFRIRKQNKKNKFTTPDFIAELKFLTAEQGGRKTNVISGYRPHIEFENYSDYLTSGHQTYLNQEVVIPGEKVKAEISIVSKDYFAKRLYKNMKFKFCEGLQTVGYGEIIEIMNLTLKKENEG